MSRARYAALGNNLLPCMSLGVVWGASRVWSGEHPGCGLGSALGVVLGASRVWSGERSGCGLVLVTFLHKNVQKKIEEE